MKTGLLKLVEAEKSVNELSKELAVKEKDLAVASKEADEVRMMSLFVINDFYLDGLLRVVILLSRKCVTRQLKQKRFWEKIKSNYFNCNNCFINQLPTNISCYRK